MAEQIELVAREHEALLALENIRATVAAIPHNHPAAASLAEALALAEGHWHDCRVALAAATKALEGIGANHPNDYWSARWRT